VTTFLMGLGIVLLPAVFSLSARKTLLLWLPFAFFLPAAMIYTLVTESPLREWALVVFMETNWHELERFWYGAAGAVLLGPLAVWLLWRLIVRKVPAGHRLGWASRVSIAILALVLPVSNFARSGWEYGSMLNQRKLSAAFPVGLAVSVWSAWNIRQNLQNRGAVGQDLVVHAASAPSPEREIYVLVIGESARFSSFQINGYARETTPLLAKTPGLLNFQNVTAPATFTLMSVPALVTPATVLHFARAASLPSVVGVFRRAGFCTAWLSTQMKHGMYDTACSMFANDADTSQFLSGSFAPGGGNYASAMDGDLLEPTRELLARHDPRLFVVLHTMGSHHHYCDRFPAAFNHFPCYPMRYSGNPLTGHFNAEQQRNLTNAYDNSILYTDWVLSQLIESLSATHSVAALYYVSDHGQNKGDAPVLPFAHGNVTRDVVHVPMLVWLSPEYRQQRPRQTQALESHLTTPFSAETTFHTLVDMAGLDCSLLDRSQSAASETFHPRPRLVRDFEGSIIDYDKALKNGAMP
jgi:glucan phosphoethanolaminetransferase (alkaline phosphatase superfamily)